MNDIQGIKVRGRHAKLIQAVCSPSLHNYIIVKAVFIGVKEEVKSICADVLDEQHIQLEDDACAALAPWLSGTCTVLAPSLQEWPRTRVRKVPQFDYDVAEIYYPKALDTIVSGNDSTIALRAFPIFQQNYGASIPLLKEYSTILWELAQAYEYTNEIIGVGLPEGERVYTLKFPKFEEFELHLLERIPQIYALARNIVKEDTAGLARAA